MSLVALDGVIHDNCFRLFLFEPCIMLLRMCRLSQISYQRVAAAETYFIIKKVKFILITFVIIGI